MSDDGQWEELFDRHLFGELSELEKERLAELLDSDTAARKAFLEHVQWDTELAEALCENDPTVREGARSVTEQMRALFQRSPKTTLLRLLLALAAVVIIALSAGLYFQRASATRRIAEVSALRQAPVPDPPIARISGLSGALIWIGDRGQVVRDLTVGTELAGGTIEGMAPDSWFELQFNDGSTVMIGGASTLTFSDLGQKELHLKQGRLSASVVRQPEGKPMLIHTRSAILEVVGTRFEVEAELGSTALHVSEGKVQVKRLSDGRTIDVSARHRIVTTPDAAMSPVPVPDAVDNWKSQLQLGPKELYGTWLPAADGRPASLRAIPFVPQENRSITLYLLGLSVNRGDSSPVLVKPGSRFVVRGRLAVAADLCFGISVVRPNGEFAGKFLARLPAAQFAAGSDFEAVFPLDQFGLDPCVWDRKDELPDKPDNLVLTGVWSFTYTGGPTGLEVTEVELVPRNHQGDYQDHRPARNRGENETKNLRS